MLLSVLKISHKAIVSTLQMPQDHHNGLTITMLVKERKITFARAPYAGARFDATNIAINLKIASLLQQFSRRSC